MKLIDTNAIAGTPLSAHDEPIVRGRVRLDAALNQYEGTGVRIGAAIAPRAGAMSGVEAAVSPAFRPMTVDAPSTKQFRVPLCPWKGNP